MALLLSFSGVAQNNYILPVGNGTTTQQTVPANMYYNYAVSQAIYHQSDINLSGEITSISWHPTGSSWGTRTWAVYLGETALDLFSSQSDLLTAEQLTEVYNGSVTTGADGWITIELSTPFTYSNESNLVIAVLITQVLTLQVILTTQVLHSLLVFLTIHIEMLLHMH